MFNALDGTLSRCPLIPNDTNRLGLVTLAKLVNGEKWSSVASKALKNPH